jgi:hypothetical protein
MGRLASLRPGRPTPVQAEPRAAIDAPQMSPELPGKLLGAPPGQVGAGSLQLVGAQRPKGPRKLAATKCRVRRSAIPKVV